MSELFDEVRFEFFAEQNPELSAALDKSHELVNSFIRQGIPVYTTQFDDFLEAVVRGGTLHKDWSTAKNCLYKERCYLNEHKPESRTYKTRHIVDINDNGPMVRQAAEGTKYSFNGAFMPKRKQGVDGYGDLEIMIGNTMLFPPVRFVRTKQHSAERFITDLVIDYPGATASIEVYDEAALMGKRRPVEVGSLSRDRGHFLELLQSRVVGSLVEIEAVTTEAVTTEGQLSIPYWQK